MPNPKQNIVYAGAKIGKLRVVMSVRTSKGYTKNWRVECECGTRFTIRQNYLTRPQPKADCGGPAHQSNKTIYKREFGIWTMMHTRTSNPKHVAYKDYGGRGIKVDEAWHDIFEVVEGGSSIRVYDGFEQFLKDMGKAPTEGHTLDRIDPDSNYGPGKCRWATWKEQANNKRSDKLKAMKINELRIKQQHAEDVAKLRIRDIDRTSQLPPHNAAKNTVKNLGLETPIAPVQTNSSLTDPRKVIIIRKD